MYKCIFIYWSRKWQPTPVFLPSTFHGQRSLAGYSPWGYKELDMIKRLSTIFIYGIYIYIWDSLVAQMVKCLPAMWETWVRSLGGEDPLEKEMATHSSILTWEIPWTEEAGGLESMGSQRVRNNWVTNFHFQGKWIRRRMKKCRREQSTHWAHWLQTILMATVHPSCPLSSHRPSQWALLSLYRSKNGKARIWPGLSDSKASQVAHW